MAQPQSTLNFDDESLPGFTVDTPFDFHLSASGGTAPYTFALTQGTLPDGVTIDSTGRIYGTPTTAGDVTAFIKLSDAAGATRTQAFDCQVS